MPSGWCVLPVPGNADLLVDWLWEVKGRYVRLADWIGKCLPCQKRSVSYRESGVTRSPDGKLVRRRILFLRSRCKGSGWVAASSFTRYRKSEARESPFRGSWALANREAKQRRRDR